MPQCRQCTAPFAITEQDRELLARLDVPEPTVCTACSTKRKFAFRNERTLYSSVCVLCRKKTLSMYHPESGYTVYCVSCIYSDRWDPLSYGQEFDFSRPFFEQFGELLKHVPRSALMVGQCENSEYVNYTYQTKNSYLSFARNFMEDCLYCNLAEKSKQCVDVDFAIDSELCHECVGVQNCYACRHVYDSQNCNSSQFLKDCSDCSDCFLCCNLRHKSYCFMNEQCSKEEYERRVMTFKKKPTSEQSRLFEEFIFQFPRRCHYNRNSEDCVGEYITKSKNCFYCYQVYEGENCRYVYTGFPTLRDSMRCCYAGENAELIYECLGTGASSQNIRWCIVAVDKCFNIEYSDFCQSSSNIFGCTSLKQKEYCILNKQYSKGDFFSLRSKIIEHMRRTGEWGLSFDPRISPFGYNETAAMDNYPVTKEEALAQGYNWRDDMPIMTGKETRSWDDIPEDICVIDESICKEVLARERTGKNYKITKQELSFYKRFNISLPRLHPEERHKDRLKRRNPFALYHRQCMCELTGHGHVSSCPAKFETTYSPDRPEKIFCEACYQKEVV